MKILYDHQIFESQVVGGISRYFCEIFKGLHASNGLKLSLSLKYSNNQYLESSLFENEIERDSSTYEGFLPGYDFKGKWSLFRLKTKAGASIDVRSANKQRSVSALQSQDFDVFHPTYYDDYFLPYLGSKPFVLTVHDMIHEIYPEYFSLADKTSQMKRHLAQMASRIIAISENTKKGPNGIF